jgi:hypothetical protein
MPLPPVPPHVVPPTNTLALPYQELTVEQLFRNLSYGELSNLYVGADGQGTIEESQYPKMIMYANEGMRRLHGKFILREDDLIVGQKAHITNYHLRTKYAESAGADVPYAYIKDLPGEPFKDDVVKIIAVYRADGYRFPLNDAGRSDSLFTPSPTILQVPKPLEGMAMSVHYQAYHIPLADGQDGRGITPQQVLDQWIELTPILHGALQSYVAAKMYSHMGGQENMLKSTEHMANYEAICAEVMMNDLATQTATTTNDKLEERGFV